MLHSIAVGNMLPADTKVIVVDINQTTVTKLMDRGTWQALGIVSDVGAFLPLVVQQIKKMQGRKNDNDAESMNQGQVDSQIKLPISSSSNNNNNNNSSSR